MASFIIIYIFLAVPDNNVIETYKKEFLAHINWRPKYQYFNVFVKDDFGKNLFAPHTYFRGIFKEYAIYCLMLASILAQGCVVPQKKWLATMLPPVLIFLTAISPLALGYIAFDRNRWIFLAISNSSALFVIFHTRMAVRWRIIFIAAAFFFFFASFVPLWGHYRRFDEFIPFIQNLGSIVTSFP